jgi:hypothetical protein
VYHRGLKILLGHRRFFSLGDIVNFLAEMDNTWKNTIHQSHLWKDKEKEYHKCQEQYDKVYRLLEHSADLLSSDTEVGSHGEEDVLDFVNSKIVSAGGEGGLLLAKKQRQVRKSIPPEQICVECKTSKCNEDCSLHICKPYCSKSTAVCRITDHQRTRSNHLTTIPTTETPTLFITTITTMSFPVPNIEEQLKSVIQARGSVCILYKASQELRVIESNELKMGSQKRLVQGKAFVLLVRD